MTIGPYDSDDLKRGLRNPSLIARALEVQSRNAGLRINDAWYRRTTPDGFDVLDEDWDNLVILDGCRYDLFEERNVLDGTLEKRVSPASESREFLQSNFGGREVHDTVYVTANPHWYELEDGTFHHVVDLLTESWDDDHDTVLPGDVVERTLEAHERFPHKRKIVHFMQPHFPFIGERGRKLDHKGITLHKDDADAGVGTDRPEGMNVWTAARLGKLPTEAVREAYAENLDIVLPHVERLVEALPGKSVITADHGNLTGDRLFPIPIRGYGHPRNLRVPELVTVPWFTVPGERLAVESSPPTSDERDTTARTDRLKALGYR